MESSWRQVLRRIALSLSGLALAGAAVIITFAAALQLASDTRPQGRVLQLAAADGAQTPDLTGRVVGVWGNTLAIDTTAGRRTLQLYGGTVIRKPDGALGLRDDLRPGLDAVVFGTFVNLQTFRADLVLLRPHQ